VVRLLRQLGEAREPESIHARLRDVRSPMLLLVGDFGHTSSPPPEEVAILRDSLPSFAVDTIAGAGHFLHEEQPAAVVERILRTTVDRRTAHAADRRTRERAAP
jgi:pimeloyl-ACP methyl ester carboxylesterase